MKVTVGLTPAEQVSAPIGIVIDVLRATSVICQAFAGGCESVTCVGEVDDARALAGPGVALAGERHNVRIEGFDYGNSPREFAEPHATKKLVLTTTNGTRALLAAAERCETVLVASLLNLRAVADAAQGYCGRRDLLRRGRGRFAIDDAYVAGRLAAALGGEHDDSAVAAVQLASVFAGDEEGIGGGVSAANIRNANLDEDIPWCARASVLDLVPRIVERQRHRRNSSI